MKTLANIKNIALKPVGSAHIHRLPSAHKADLILLSAQMNVEQLFEAIAANCLAQIKANAAALAHGYDAEVLHQMRVGLRRLRVAFDLFEDFIELPALLQQELDWLNAQLSSARDWDVLAQSTLPLLTADLPDVYQRMLKLPAVKHAICSQVRQQHKTALTALRSQRYLNLMQQLTSWIDARGWRNTLSAKRCRCLLKPVVAFARHRLVQQQQRLVKRGGRLASTCAQRVHHLRIAAKTMRYTTEFFQSLYPGKRVQPALDSLSRLQLRLGRINDMAVATVLLLQLQHAHPQIAENIHLLRAYMQLKSKRQVKKVPALWKKSSLIKCAI